MQRAERRSVSGRAAIRAAGPPVEALPLSRVRVFVSYDRDSDRDLYALLAEQASKSTSRFEIAARSGARAATSDTDEARSAIREADQIVVICGEHTDQSEAVASELRIAQEEARPYLLLWGRRERMCTKPASARSADAMYSWTGEILERQLDSVRRVARSHEQLAGLSRQRASRAAVERSPAPMSPARPAQADAGGAGH